MAEMEAEEDKVEARAMPTATVRRVTAEMAGTEATAATVVLAALCPLHSGICRTLVRRGQGILSASPSFQTVALAGHLELADPAAGVVPERVASLTTTPMEVPAIAADPAFQDEMGQREQSL